MNDTATDSQQENVPTWLPPAVPPANPDINQTNKVSCATRPCPKDITPGVKTNARPLARGEWKCVRAGKYQGFSSPAG